MPERYRGLFIASYLEGKTQDEAAAQLGLGKTTLKDGLLDKEEIRKFAANPGLLGENPQGGGRRERGAAVNLERVIGDLGVRGETRQKTRAAVQAHQNAVRKFLDKSQADLLDQM